jgi:hypothetical protein
MTRGVLAGEILCGVRDKMAIQTPSYFFRLTDSKYKKTVGEAYSCQDVCPPYKVQVKKPALPVSYAERLVTTVLTNCEHSS